MEYDGDVRWDLIPQIAGPVGGSSVFASVMAMIPDLGVNFFEGLKANMALGCLIVPFSFFAG